MGEKFFSDKSFVEQSTIVLQREDGTKVNGVSIMVACPPETSAVEVVLEQDEIRAALAEIQGDEAIESLVDKFLAWPLPESVCADLCATRRGDAHRSGTNLLTAEEARQMLEYLLK